MNYRKINFKYNYFGDYLTECPYKQTHKEKCILVGTFAEMQHCPYYNGESRDHKSIKCSYDEKKIDNRQDISIKEIKDDPLKREKIITISISYSMLENLIKKNKGGIDEI